MTYVILRLVYFLVLFLVIYYNYSLFFIGKSSKVRCHAVLVGSLAGGRFTNSSVQSFKLDSQTHY